MQAAANPPSTASGRHPAVLLVLSPSGQRARVPLNRFPFSIGRQADNDLVLRDNRASRYQARILADGGHYVIEDLNSRHGTLVNGLPVVRHILRHSDRIEIAVRDSYQLTFALESGGINRLMEQFASAPHGSPAVGAGTEGTGNLANLRSLMEVARAMQDSLSTEEILTAVVDAALKVTGCERGFLLLRQEKGLDNQLEVAVARDSFGHPLESTDLRIPTSVLQRALESRRDLLSMNFDPLEQSGIRPEHTVASLELRSVVCVPLVKIRGGGAEETRISPAAENTAGLLYLDSRLLSADLSGGNRELLQTLAIEASTILENARLMEQERGKQRLEDELKIARDIQQGLLPPALPSDGWFRAAGSSVPATQVGGDYFDVRRISNDLWAVVVADVSGKGVSSALLASLLQGAFMMATGGASEMEPMMERLNAFLLERTRGEKYATMFYCTVHSSGQLRYVNAGHCAPFLAGPENRLRKLHTSGMPVGMIEGATFQIVEIQMEPHDKLVIFSDGLTEAENAEGEFFGTERLRTFLRDHGRHDAISVHQRLMRELDQFTEGGVIRDDITALVVEYLHP